MDKSRDNKKRVAPANSFNRKTLLGSTRIEVEKYMKCVYVKKKIKCLVFELRRMNSSAIYR